MSWSNASLVTVFPLVEEQGHQLRVGRYVPDFLTIRVWLPALASAHNPLPGITCDRQQTFLPAVRESVADYRMTVERELTPAIRADYMRNRSKRGQKNVCKCSYKRW